MQTTRREARTLITVLAQEFSSYVIAAVAHVRRRIAELEAKLARLEQRPAGLKYVGVWRRGETYREQDVVTHGGAAWVAPFGDTGDEPGKSPAWKLMAKSR